MTDPESSDRIPPSPFPGIEPFNYSDRRIFFAREDETRSLIRLVVMYRGALLYSESGIGKSSLVNAGLVPLAQDEGYQPVSIRVQPVGGQEIIVERIAENTYGEPPFLPSIFASRDEREHVVLSTEDFGAILRRRDDPSIRPLLIFDQFEEWVTLFEEGSSEEAASSQERVQDVIISLINDVELPVKVLLVLREEYLAKLESIFEACPDLPDQFLRLTPLSGDQIFRVIRGPFEAYPGAYQPEIRAGLAQKIRSQFESRSGGADIRLTEVQIVCRSLFDSGKQRSELEGHFESEGGVQGILEQYLERALDQLDEDHRDPAVGLLTRMVTSAGTRNVISREDLVSRVANEDGIPRRTLTETLDSLEQQAKLVRRERRREVYYYEIASEFLVGWIQRKREERLQLIEQRKRLEAERDAEEQRQRAEELRQLNEELEAARDTALRAQKQAEELAQLSFVLRLASGAVVQLDTDPERSVLLARQAVWETQSAGRPVTPEAEEALHRAVGASRVRLRLSGHTDTVRGVAYSPDGVLLATAGQDQVVRLWDSISGQQLQALSGHEGWVTSVAFSPDGKQVASSSGDGTVRVWDASTGEERLRLAHDGTWVWGVAYSPDGRLLASAGTDSFARVWEAATGENVLELVHNQPVHALAFSPDGRRLATACHDHSTSVWDLEASLAQGAAIRKFLLVGHSYEVYGLDFSPDGRRLATASRDGLTKIWSMETGEELHSLSGHTDTVNAVAFSPDGSRLVTASMDQTAKVWEAKSGEELFTLLGHEGWVMGAAFSPDGTRLATASGDRTCRIWVAGEGEEVLTISAHTNAVNRVAFSPDGRRLFSASSDTTAMVWDADSGDLLMEMFGHNGAIYALALSRDGTLAATGGFDQVAKVWDTASGEVRQALEGHEGWVNGVAFSPDGSRLATSSMDKTARVWDLATGEELLILEGHTDMVYDVAFRPDGARLATASYDNTVKLWDSTSGELLETYTGHDIGVYDLTFSPDGSRLASAGFDRTARIWRIGSSEEEHILSGHNGWVNAVTFSPDGRRLITAGQDRKVKIWDVRTGHELLTLSGHSDAVQGVAISPDGGRLATAGMDQTVRLYDLRLDEIMLLARRRVTRSMTEKECQEFLDSRERPSSVAAMGTYAQGSLQARAGALDEAVVSFAQAQEEDHSLNLDPEVEARQLAVAALLEKGRTLARVGQAQAAAESFRQAQALDPALEWDPEPYAARLAAFEQVRKGVQLVQAGRVQEAVRSFKLAEDLDPGVPISPISWNSLCWHGSLNGAPGEVMEACNRGVEAAPWHGNIFDSRGVARALTGDRRGAIEDFEFFIQWAEGFGFAEELIGKRRAWIEKLRAGEDPIDEATLEELREE